MKNGSSGKEYEGRFSIYNAQPATITLISPNDGEQLNAGYPCLIAWTWEGAVGNVKIDYSTDNGSTWTAVVASTENDGEYRWMVPNV